MWILGSVFQDESKNPRILIALYVHIYLEKNWLAFYSIESFYV